MADDIRTSIRVNANEDYIFHQAVIQNSSLYVLIFSQFIPEKLKVQDEQGRTPLSYAAELGRFMMIPMLTGDNDELITAADNTGSFPLHYAAKYAQAECFTCLLAINAKLLTVQNKLGETPISLLNLKDDSSPVEGENAPEHVTLPEIKLAHKLREKGQMVMEKIYFSISLCEILFYCGETAHICETKRH
jgi:ankyrin repeat protein